MGVCCIVFDVDGMVSPNSRWGQWESIPNIILYSLVLIFDLKHIKCGGGWGGGGGGGNIFLAFYSISNISRKNKFWE